MAVAAVLFTLSLATLCLAQESRASIAGTVTDPSGSVVAAAKLQLTNVETGVSFGAASNDVGQYRFLFVNPGKYKLTAELAGFRTFVRENMQLQVSQTATVDITLQVGSQTESVTVGAEAPLLEAEKADRGLVINNRNVVELPLNIRNPIMLAALTPGIQATTVSLDQNPFSNSGISSWSVNGSSNKTTDFLLDGAPNNAVYNQENTIAYVPPIEAVQEFKVMTSTYDAQYGRSGGGTVNVSLKSGTNALHGSAYEFLKRTGLNANTFADNSKGNPRQGNALDQYGFTLGGPVVLPKIYNGRDKTFFFFAYEGYGEDIFRANESIASVPTLDQRKGDFSKTFDNRGALMPVYDPLSTRLSGSSYIRDLFPGNVIPSGRINPVGAKVLNAYPAPNGTTPGSTDWQNNFYNASNVGRFDFENYTARVDHHFGPRQRVYGRWVFNDFIQGRVTNGLTGLGANARTGGKRNDGIVIDSVTMVNPSTILNLRVSLTRWVEDIYLPDNIRSFRATEIGWPQALVNQLPGPDRFPFFSVSGYTSLGNDQVSFEPTNVFSFQPNAVLMRGRHAIKAGLDYRITRWTRYRPEFSGARMNFDRGFTRRDYNIQDAMSGNGAASLLAGYAVSGQIDNQTRPYYQWIYYAPWVQDDIKLARRLTLNVGLRWDYSSPVTEFHNRVNRGFLKDQVNPISSRIDQTKFPGYKVNGGIGFAGVNGLPRSPFNPDRNNIQPRAGAAYQLNSRTVLRGGYGIFYTNSVSNGNEHGYSLSTPYVATLDSGRTPANNLSNPFPSGVLQPPGSSLGLMTLLGQGPSFVNPDVQLSYVHQFSFGIQRQLPGNMSIDASYVGSRTMAVPVSKGYNDIGVELLDKGNPQKGGNPNWLNEQLPNPFAGLIPGTALNNATTSRSQLARPYPQFSGFSIAQLSEGRLWYNSFQMTFEKRYSRGLTATVTYTLSKNIEGVTYLNSQDAQPTRSLTDWDRTHRLVIAPIYDLPFGPGRRFLNTQNPILGRIAGGWEAIVTTIVQTGDPMNIPSNVYLLGDPRLENPTWDRMFKTGVIDVDGTVRNVLPGESPVFAVRPPNSLRTTPARYGNFRNQWARTYNMSLIKNTRIREKMSCQFRAEAFNAFNTPIFSSDPDQSPTSTNFGKIFRTNGQNNLPRNIQLGVRFIF
ncbi:MAG: TonB-dependent receptor [Acidobacteria bacterium]|nr:TonB-dependent receptor [Acidobacteriota bacterium]